MRVVVVALFLLAACASSGEVVAQSAQPSSPVPVVAAEAATYTLDATHTQVGFSVSRFGLNSVMGRFEEVSGEVRLDPQHPERSSVRAIIPIASLSTGNAERDGFLRGRFWLKGDQFPTMEFRSTSVNITGPQRAEVVGDLTLAGVTAPVTMDVTLNGQGPDPAVRRAAAGFTATATLSRSQFGIRTALPAIGDEVRITIEALGHTGEAAPAPPAAPRPQ